MPKGPGTYGSKVGRPKKKKKIVGKKKRKVGDLLYRGKPKTGLNKKKKILAAKRKKK